MKPTLTLQPRKHLPGHDLRVVAFREDLAWQLESLPSADGEAVSQLFQSLSCFPTKTTNEEKIRQICTCGCDLHSYTYWCSKGRVYFEFP